jgi:succinate dehydrogenase / fumarate reductase flavoprotein subunit
LAPFRADGDENAYTLHQDLQQIMNDLVGIIRTAEEVGRALEEIATLKQRATRLAVIGDRRFNPGWHLALDLSNMLRVSECIAMAALERKESRGGHTRNDYPLPDPEWGKINIVLREDDDQLRLYHQPLPEMPAELAALLEEK